MDVKKLKETIEKRILTDEEYDYGLKQCWDAMADILLSDIPGAVEFLQTCTDKELYWITECFIELFDKKPSREIYDAVEKRCETIRNKEYRRSIKVELDFVRWTLKSDTDEDGQEDGRKPKTAVSETAQTRTAQTRTASAIKITNAKTKRQAVRHLRKKTARQTWKNCERQ